MNLEVRPILSALLRNRTGAVLVALQIALALAVLVNALYIVVQRVEKMHRPTGLDVDNVIVIATTGFTDHYQEVPAMRADLDYLRSVDGVIAAGTISGIPLSSGGDAQQLVANPTDHPIDNFNDFEIDESALDALGARLVAGRNFRREEIQPPLGKEEQARFVSQIIITRAAGERLFPGQNPLGKVVYDGLKQPATIIGVVDPMMGAFPLHDQPEWVFLMPRVPNLLIGAVNFVVRTRPGQRDAVMRTIEAHLPLSNPDRVVRWVRPLSYFRDLSYLSDRAMSIYLLTVTVLVIGICALGIFALATFTVSTRTKQIGTRRAVGARRRDIVRHFLVENALITSAGVIIGCALALATGYWLSVHYALPRLNLYFLVGGILALWGIGQLSAWQPARRAAAVSPAVATRTV
jgi:putative ABC transport system permease protein